MTPLTFPRVFQCPGGAGEGSEIDNDRVLGPRGSLRWSALRRPYPLRPARHLLPRRGRPARPAGSYINGVLYTHLGTSASEGPSSLE